MDIVVEPEMYVPSVDDAGNYVDSAIHSHPHGMRCPCGSRREKVYPSSSSFAVHLKTKCHQAWLAELNRNKTNYFIECQTLKETVESQRIILARLEKDLQNKLLTIDYLTAQLTKAQHTNAAATTADREINLIDLMDFENPCP
jgi:hypothetical protein